MDCDIPAMLVASVKETVTGVTGLELEPLEGVVGIDRYWDIT